MGCHQEANKTSYWNTDSTKGPVYHNLRNSISQMRFEWVESNFHCSKPPSIKSSDSGDSGIPFDKVIALSDRLQVLYTKYYFPGSQVAVDETIQGFTSRAKEIVNIPVKPTPKGVKIWVIADAGFVWGW
jgi:hypothetical protein